MAAAAAAQVRPVLLLCTAAAVAQPVAWLMVPELYLAASKASAALRLALLVPATALEGLQTDINTAVIHCFTARSRVRGYFYLGVVLHEIKLAVHANRSR